MRGGAWFGLGLRLRLYHYTRPADRDCCDGRQISAALLEPLHRKWWPRAVTQQLLQPCAVGRFDAHPGIDREAASVGISGHVFGVTCLNVTACHKGAQDAFAHVGLNLAKSRLIKVCGCVKSYIVWLRLKHPIAHAHMKVHMRVQAGAKAVDARRLRPGAGWRGLPLQRWGNAFAKAAAPRAGRCAVPH